MTNSENSEKKAGLFFLDQHGCAKNQVDGELIITRLLNLGWKQTFQPEEASLIIVNSCGFIQSAKEESIDAVCQARSLYPDAKILLTGCLAERYAENFKEALPEADGIFGNGDLSKIDQVISDLQEGQRPVQTYKQEGVCSGDRKVLLGYKGSAFVKITEGCSNHCSFCAIPLIRGELRSRPADQIIQEIKDLVSSGVVEINLIGQDLAAYGSGKDDNVFGDGRLALQTSLPQNIDLNSSALDEKSASSHKSGQLSQSGQTTQFDKSSQYSQLCQSGQFSQDASLLDKTNSSQESGLARLLQKISQISGSFVVRLLYIHPDHFNFDIFPAIKADSRILPYFDIPFQSGDDQIIQKMNRRGSSQSYRALVQKIRNELPQAVIRTTFLTGFPGESDKNAENTRSFLSAIQSDWSGCFPYSREEDTPAYSYKNRVSSKIAEKRSQLLQELQSEITHKKLLKKVGKTFGVLVEEVVSDSENSDGEGLAICRAWFQAPEVDGNVVVRYDLQDKAQAQAVKTGAVLNVKIIAVSGVDLDAVFISSNPKYSQSQPSGGLLYAPELL